MKKLMLMIREEAEKRGITNSETAKRLNVSTGQASNYTNGIYFIPFVKFIEYLEFVFPNGYPNSYLTLYIKELQKKKKLEYAKEAAEWLFVNGKEEEALKLVEKYRGYDSHFDIYDLLFQRSRKHISKKQFLIEVENCRENGNDTPETKAIYRIAHIYGIMDHHGYMLINFYADQAMEWIKLIKNEFLQTSFEMRLSEIRAVAYLMNDEADKAEEICVSSISKYDQKLILPICKMLSVLSEIYVFRSYEKSLDYNRKAFELLKRTGMKNLHVCSVLESTHDFIKIFHGDYDNLYLSDPAEKVHYLASSSREEDREQALAILKELERESAGLTPHQLYYKGLALKDKKLLQQSENEFAKKGNLYYSILPRLKQSSF